MSEMYTRNWDRLVELAGGDEHLLWEVITRRRVPPSELVDYIVWESVDRLATEALALIDAHDAEIHERRTGEGNEAT